VGPGRAAYTKDVRRTNQIFRVRTLSMKLRVLSAKRLAESSPGRTSVRCKHVMRPKRPSRHVKDDSVRVQILWYLC
jgi:hypothetical protein